MVASPESNAVTWSSDLDSASASDRDHVTSVRPDSNATWDKGRYTYSESFATKQPVARPFSSSTSQRHGATKTSSPPTIRVQPTLHGQEPDSGGRSILIVVLRYDLRIHDNALFY